MSNTVLITKLLDGVREATFHIYIESDGVSGDSTDAVLIDPATDLEPSMDGPSLTIEKFWYDLSGFNAKLEFDYLATDTPIWTISGDQPGFVDFSHIGGLKDRSFGDGSGKLMLNTSGLGAGDFGTIIIKVRK